MVLNLVRSIHSHRGIHITFQRLVPGILEFLEYYSMANPATMAVTVMMLPHFQAGFRYYTDICMYQLQYCILGYDLLVV